MRLTRIWLMASALPSTSGASPLSSRRQPRSSSSSPMSRAQLSATVRKSSLDSSISWPSAFCSVSRSLARRVRRSHSLMIWARKRLCSSSGTPPSSRVSAVPRMAVSGVRISWLTSLTNCAWRASSVRSSLTLSTMKSMTSRGGCSFLKYSITAGGSSRA